MEKNNIIYFINENHVWGGGEKMFMWLSKKLYADGYDIRYCMLYRSDEIDTTHVKTDYLDFKFSNSYLVRNFRYFIVGTYKIAKYIKKNRVKQVVCFGFNSFYILGILKHFMGFKLLVSERGDPRKKRWSGLRKMLFAGCEASVFQTDGAKQFYDKNKEDVSYVIPNPVKLPKDAWEDIENQKYVITVGRIDFEQKRQDLLIKSFSQVLTQVPDAKLLIVGGGYDEERLRTMVDNYHITDSVIMCGFQKDVFKFLKKANVFVLTSDFEGLPNALLEAMAFGMPVISTDCSPGGAAFLIGNNEKGMLVPRGDEKALAGAIIDMLSDKDRRCFFAQKARLAMKEYDEGKIIEQWKKVIDKTFEN